MFKKVYRMDWVMVRVRVYSAVRARVRLCFRAVVRRGLW